MEFVGAEAREKALHLEAQDAMDAETMPFGAVSE